MKTQTLTELVLELLGAGYSQQDIAKIAKVSQMTISRWAKDSPKNMTAKNRLEKFAEKMRK